MIPGRAASATATYGTVDGGGGGCLDGRPMKPLYDFSNLAVDRTISPRDTMMEPNGGDEYFQIGHRALEWVRFSAELCDKPHYPRVLDLGCGHGRVLRWLRPYLHYAEITACDIDRDAVDFCCRHFGAVPAYSTSDLRALPFHDKFDLIWCGSLLTHLDEAQWQVAFDCLVDWTTNCGVILFTAQGRYFASRLARQHRFVADDVDQTALLDGLRRHGFAYQPYFGSTDRKYGITLTSPEWLSRHVQRHPGLILRSYLEEVWGQQDLVMLYKCDGYFAPVLAPL
jgi:SAM-dependent methyltransferase